METQQQNFFDLQIPFTRDLAANFEGIRQEFRMAAQAGVFSSWPETALYNKGWNVFGLRFQGQDVKAAHEMCPISASFIKKYDTLVDTFGFSSLAPGTILYPHVGYTDKVLRCHMGIDVPSGDCFLKVGGELRKWEDGRVFMFDDTIEHEAWNKTDSDRIVLLIDVDRAKLSMDQN